MDPEICMDLIALSALGIETRFSEKGTAFDKYIHTLFENSDLDESSDGRRISRTVVPGLVQKIGDTTEEKVLLKEEVIIE